MKLCGQPHCICTHWDGTRAGETRLVADSYRTELHRTARGWIDDPAQSLADLDALWHDHGVHWHVPTQQPLEPDAWMTAADVVMHLAHLASFTEKDVRQWNYRGHITTECAPDGSPRYNIGEIIEYLTRRRRRTESTANHDS